LVVVAAISLDIEGNWCFRSCGGPVFLFWAIFGTEANEPSAAELQQVRRHLAARKFWRFKLAWSE